MAPCAHGRRPSGRRGSYPALVNWTSCGPAAPAGSTSRSSERELIPSFGNIQEHGRLWISGDTVLYDGVREVAERVPVDTAPLHLGGVQFPVTGPVRYTMTARDAVELCRLVRPRTAIPIHYEGWKHFRQGRAAVEREFAAAPEDVRRCIRWLPMGAAVALA